MTIGEMSSWLLDNDDNIAEYNYKSGTWAIVIAICRPRDKSLAHRLKDIVESNRTNIV